MSLSHHTLRPSPCAALAGGRHLEAISTQPYSHRILITTQSIARSSTQQCIYTLQPSSIPCRDYGLPKCVVGRGTLVERSVVWLSSLCARNLVGQTGRPYDVCHMPSSKYDVDGVTSEMTVVVAPCWKTVVCSASTTVVVCETIAVVV